MSSTQSPVESSPSLSTGIQEDLPAGDEPLPTPAGNGATESSIESSTRADLVRQAAYRRYRARGTAHGDEVQDWLEAEAEINQSFVE